MAIVKPHANKTRTTSPIEESERLIEEMSNNPQSSGFTSLDLGMIELENFLLHCPLPLENLSGQME
ncbi:type IV secretion system protein VirE1 [Agrobacterium tumefaciens]|uniref:type IV secretion system protein VirE1 n=1 Tax=Agrobacterium tumefaciens TaxID=358 RepID=UPI001572A623|nr:type IV secretion system protein VirE1 [Agrobacterium tumefaciens]WCK69556.1 type IV secretion system protein VirE1 [Agrobacterium tumefaciens]